MTDEAFDRRRRAVLIVLSAVAGLLLLRFFSGRITAALFPFVFAYLLARLTLVPARFLSRKTRIPVRTWSVLLTLSFFFLIGFGTFLLVRQLITECGEILAGVLSDPDLPSRIAGTLESFSSFILSRVPGGAGGPLLSESDLAGMVRDAIASLFSWFSRLVGGILSRIPAFLLSLLASVFAAVWFAADPDAPIRLFRLLPSAWQRRGEQIGRGLFRGAGTVFYAYGILFCVTFLILFCGLALLGAPYALLVSFLVALFDLLPVLGAGGILVPWGIVSMVSGRAAFGACILFLSFLVFAVRGILTPRLFGRGLGIHPLLAFFAVYAGLRLAGFAGVLCGLILSVLLSRALARRAGKAPDTE
ncbi:MAG: AI-2E family transporter [Clostridia bacterium]|nr:AI-2E family transporter [Clostridia bacterium]